MKLNLKQKSFIFVAVSVLALLAMYVSFGEYYVSQSEARIKEEQRARAATLGSELDAFLERGVQKLQVVAELPGLVYGLERWESDLNGRHLPFWTTLHYLFYQSDVFTGGVYLIDPAGRILWSEPPDVNLINTEYAPHQLIEQTAAGAGEDYAANVWRSGPDDPQMLLSLPLKDSDEHVAGYLVGSIPANHPYLMSLFRPDTEASLSLLDAQGIPVLSDRPENKQRVAYAPLLVRANSPIFEHATSTARLLVAHTLLKRAPWRVTVERDFDIALESVYNLRFAMGAFGVMLALISIGTLVFTLRSFTRPVEALTQDARRMAAGDFSGTFTLTRGDELGILSSALNEMKAKLKSSYDALLVSERSHVMAKVVAGIAHELNNPLTVVVGQIQLLMMRDMDDAMRERMSRIYDAAERSSKIVRNLLTFSRQRKPERERTDINAVVKKTVDLRIYELQVANIEVSSQFDPGLPWTMADAHQIQQVILNLIVNAEQAMAEAHGRGTLSVRTYESHGTIHIVIADDGPGIPEKNLHRVFDPFFTTKPAGKGTGLGLSICQGIITEHRGNIEISSSAKGATFDISLPIAHEAEPAADPIEELALAPVGPRKNILLVDDEPHIRELAHDLLEPEEYRIQTADNGRAALEMIRKEDFDLIITDLMMPELGGEQVYAEVQAHNTSSRPQKVLFMTGDLMNPDTQQFLEQCGVPWVGKPFDISFFRQKVQSVLAN